MDLARKFLRVFNDGWEPMTVVVHWSAFDDAEPACGATKPTWRERDTIRVTPDIKKATCQACRDFHAKHIIGS